MSDPVSAPTSVELRGLFVTAFDNHALRCAVVDDTGRHSTYAEIGAQANRLAHFLHTRELVSGDAVAIMLTNRTEFVVADQACIRAGVAKVAINGMLSEAEQRQLLESSGARVAIVDEEQLPVAELVAASSRDLDVVVVGGRGGLRCLPWEAALDGQPDHLPERVPSSQGMGRLSFTGGTTGLPKAVVHRNDRIALNLVCHLLEMDLREEDRMLLVPSLAHAAGLFMEAALLRGATVHLANKFDAAAAIARMRKEEITYAFVVPTMLYRLLDALEVDGVGLPALRTMLYGAAPVNPDQLRRGMEMLGPVFIQFYGQVEAPNFITRLSRRDHAEGLARPEILTSCGRAITMASVRVVDANGQPINPGEVGEVVVKAPYLMAEYRDNTEATAEALRGEWLHTGDLGRVDHQGYLHLVDRSKDMVITGGLNVYCREVEAAISALPGVADVAVFGVPDVDWGEAVVAAVVPQPGSRVDPDEVRAQAGATLARYKLPKSVRVVASLPLTGVGKHDKKALRVWWADTHDLSGASSPTS
jgi:fatty-acyl-CoA synthase